MIAALTCGQRALAQLFCAGAVGAQRAPGLPCALDLLEGRFFLAQPGCDLHRGDVRVCLFLSVVTPRESGVSSTPRLLGSSREVSGMLDRPVKPDDDGGDETTAAE